MTYDWNHHPMDIDAGNARRGFTVIELLVVIGVASLVMIGTVRVFSKLSVSYTTETSRADAQQDIRSGMGVMVEDIRSAGLDPMGTADAGIIVATSGDIEFTADLDVNGQIDNDHWERIRYYLSGTQLIQRLYDDSATDEVLLDNVTQLEFDYLDVDNASTTSLSQIQTVVIAMTVEEPAGRYGTVDRTLTERIRLRNTESE